MEKLDGQLEWLEASKHAKAATTGILRDGELVLETAFDRARYTFNLVRSRSGVYTGSAHVTDRSGGYRVDLKGRLYTDGDLRCFVGEWTSAGVYHPVICQLSPADD